MADEEATKAGTICLRVKGQFTKKLKKHFVLLYPASKSGVARIEVYENEKASSSGAVLIMLVDIDVIKVHKFSGTPQDERHSFVITTKTHPYVFCAKDAIECDEWVKAIQETLMKPLLAPAQLQQSKPKVIVDNDVYDSFEDVCREYKVTLGAETRQKLAVDGQVRLVVENGYITIIAPTGNRIVRWGIKELRRIGYSDSNFRVEAGRKSETGEGTFLFVTNAGKQIHKCVEVDKERYCRNPEVRRVVPPPAGLLAAVKRPESPPLSIGGHTYEDLGPLLPPAKALEACCAVKENRLSDYNQQLEKPRRTPVPPTSEAAPIPPPSLPGNGKGSHSPQLSIKTAQPIKSQPTKNGLIHLSSEMVKGHKTLTPLPPIPADAIYREVTEYKDAWKQYGIEDDNLDEAEESAVYDNLQWLKPTPEVHENHFSPNLDMERVRQQQPKLENIPPIYAQIYKKKNKPVNQTH